MSDCAIYGFEDLETHTVLKFFWSQLLKEDKTPTFTPEALVEVHAQNPIFKKPNAEIRSWARANIRKKYARRLFNGHIAVFFFEKAEDAVIFKMSFAA